MEADCVIGYKTRRKNIQICQQDFAACTFLLCIQIDRSVNFKLIKKNRHWGAITNHCKIFDVCKILIKTKMEDLNVKFCFLLLMFT